MIWKIFSRLPAKFADSQDYASECYKRDIIAVGWNDLGDVGRVVSRLKLRDKVQKQYGIGTLAAAQAAASIWSFYHDVAIGDYILCPDKRSRRVYLGQVPSEAFHDMGEVDAGCPFANRRKVSWKASCKSGEVEKVLGRHYGGRRTISRFEATASDLRRLLRGKRQVFQSRRSIPFRPDKEWGDKAEGRAMQWLRDEGYDPRNVAHANKGWDIECKDEVFEVKGRKSVSTFVRLTGNEWRAANRLGKRYTLLIFTASDEKKLRLAYPEKFPNPAKTESWTTRERVILEYFLDQ